MPGGLARHVGYQPRSLMDGIPTYDSLPYLAHGPLEQLYWSVAGLTLPVDSSVNAKFTEV